MWSMFVIRVLPHQNNERHIYLDVLYKLPKPSFDGAYDYDKFSRTNHTNSNLGNLYR
jgi:hypothetical protein